MKKPLYLLDGYSLIYRSYFAFMGRHLTSPDGRNTSAVFGFFRSLISFFEEYSPEYFAVIMDSRVPTFRHERYADYKANREKAPQELHEQVPVIQTILETLGVKVSSVDRYEADDIIATLAEACLRDERPCRIITGDKDLLQLVGKGITVLKPDKSTYIELDNSGVYEKFGVKASQVIDYLSLVGDQADNIPGVRGIGPKTAVKLLNEYGTLDGVYENLDNLVSGQKNKLFDSKNDAYLSRELIVLKRDVPLDFTIEDLRMGSLNREAGAGLLIKEGAQTLAEKLSPRTGTLFDVLPPEDMGAGGVPDPGPDYAQKGSYEIILTEEKLDALIRRIMESRIIALDTETTGLDEMKADLVGISIALDTEKGYYIPLLCPDAECLSAEIIRMKLSEALSDPTVRIIGQNIKYDYKVLKRFGIQFVPYFDTMIAAWMIDSHSGSYGMDNLALRLFNYQTIHYNDIVPKGASIADVAVERTAEYAAEDVYVTYRLYLHFQGELPASGLEDLFYKTEIPLIPVLGDMELEGIRLNPKALKEFGEELGLTIAGLEDEIFLLCGRVFNVNSTKQLQEVLFGDRKLKPVKKTKTGYSTDLNVLQELAREDPVPALVLKHRTLSKLKSTYVDTLPDLIHTSTGRIHSRFNQTGTRHRQAFIPGSEPAEYSHTGGQRPANTECFYRQGRMGFYFR